MTNYYTLFVYEQDHGRWYNHFGDYDKEVVADEMDDLNHGWEGILLKNMRIVKTPDDQSAIDAVLDKLNGKDGLS